MLEVVNHLLDEEREDFRTRLDIALHRPMDPWPPIDPQGWVEMRHYNDRDLAASWAEFHSERQASMEELAGLSAPDWESACEAPFGSMRAGDLLAAWVAHDLLHMRQLVEIHYAYALRLAEPYDVTYAGTW